jgi:neutral ceramidase
MKSILFIRVFGRKTAFLRKIWRMLAVLGATCLALISSAAEHTWSYGVAETKITPEKLFWMGGFAARTKPAEGTLDDLKVKALVLEAEDGGRLVLVTLDLVGVPKWLYDNLCSKLEQKHGLKRSQLRFAASHTHSGPVLKDALSDIYPLDDTQRFLIAEYSAWIEKAILATVEQALAKKTSATLWVGEGTAHFAVNRRSNKEADAVESLKQGLAPKGPSDFSVPVLAIRASDGTLKGVVFGYAAHTSALTDNYLWSADYSGVTQLELEEKHRGATAFFFQGCGGDQSALPRGTVALCRERGKDLAKAVEDVLSKPMRSLKSRFRSAFDFVDLPFGEQPSTTELETIAKGTDYRARWARRLRGELDQGRTFQSCYAQFPVQVWNLGDDQLWIALGGEACIDYALRFKREFGSRVWVTAYANDVMAYIPSRRIWEEGGYQAGAFEVYGLPANKWCSDIEERIAGTVAKLVKTVR